MPIEKQFNTAGFRIADDHYLIDPLERIDYRSLPALIDSKRYCVLHAPRQTGKTTSIRTLADRLNAEGRYRTVHASIEAAHHNAASKAHLLIFNRRLESGRDERAWQQTRVHAGYAVQVRDA